MLIAYRIAGLCFTEESFHEFRSLFAVHQNMFVYTVSPILCGYKYENAIHASLSAKNTNAIDSNFH